MDNKEMFFKISHIYSWLLLPYMIMIVNTIKAFVFFAGGFLTFGQYCLYPRDGTTNFKLDNDVEVCDCKSKTEDQLKFTLAELGE